VADGVLPVAAAGAGGGRVGAGGAGRRGRGAAAHRDDAEFAVIHGVDHGGRRGGGQRHPAGDLRRPRPPGGGDVRRGRRGRGGRRRWTRATPTARTTWPPNETRLLASKPGF